MARPRRQPDITPGPTAQQLLKLKLIKSDLIEWARYVQPPDQQYARHHLFLLEKLQKLAARHA